jgi:CheY-like chemotaxis protein
MKYWLASAGPGYAQAMTPMTAPKKRILIVDDSPTARAWQRLLLQLEQYDTLTANDGAEGIRVARLERPDLILLDVGMPKMDGFEACRALRAAPETRDIPILMVSTQCEMAQVLAGFEAGCNEYLTKPLERDEYLTKIRRYLNPPLDGAA